MKSLGRAVLLLCAGVVAGCGGAPDTILGFGQSANRATMAAEIPAADATFAFEPFSGVPVTLGDALTASLGQQGLTYNLNVVPRLKADADYRVRCRILASSMDTEATISFTCGIFSQDGRNIHRIAGLLPGGASYGDPWSSYVEGSMAPIANAILYRLRNWVYG